MSIDNWLVTENPISKARSFEGFSLERLGKRLGVSKQYLSRAEHGTYLRLNRNVLRWAAETLDMSVREVERAYEEFQHRTRRQTVESLLIEPLFRTCSTGHTSFKNWRESYWPSVMAFSKAFCVHPSSVENYEEGIVESMPLIIMDVLREFKLLDPNWTEKHYPIRPGRPRGATRQSESLSGASLR